MTWKIVCIVACVATAALATAQLDLAAREKAMAQGTVTYHVLDGAGHSKEAKIIYDGKGRFFERWTNPTQFGRDVSSVTFVKGDRWYYEETKRLDLDFIEFGAGHLRDSDPKFFIVDRPSFPLAAGTSNLTDLKFLKSGRKTIVSGTLSDRTEVKLTYGSQLTKTIPDTLERSFKGRLLNRWEYSGSLRTSNGIWIPQLIRYTLPAPRGRGHRAAMNSRTFTIRSADFTAPTPDQLAGSNWFHAGATIQDARYFPPVVWTYDELRAANKGKDTLDPHSLSELSNKKWHAIHDKRPRNTQAIVIQTVLSLLFVSSMLVFLYRKRRQTVS